MNASPAEVIEFVLDLERYRQADRKIGRVRAVHRANDHGTATFSGRVVGLPGPSGTYPFTVSDHGLRFGGPVAGAARWFLDFEGTFDCRPSSGLTVVTHRESFRFKRPWRWFLEPLLRGWLQRDTTEEMARFKTLVEAPSPRR